MNVEIDNEFAIITHCIDKLPNGDPDAYKAMFAIGHIEVFISGLQDKIKSLTTTLATVNDWALDSAIKILEEAKGEE